MGLAGLRFGGAGVILGRDRRGTEETAENGAGSGFHKQRTFSPQFMIAGLKTIAVTSGCEAEFERLFAELRELMRLHEPGCLLYSLLRSRRDPRSDLLFFLA